MKFGITAFCESTLDPARVAVVAEAAGFDRPTEGLSNHVLQPNSSGT